MQTSKGESVEVSVCECPTEKEITIVSYNV